MAEADFWNERYSAEDYAFGTAPNEYFKSKLDSLTPGDLIVPAAGEGRDAVYAAKLGWRVTGLDLSQQGKDKALKLAAANGVAIRYDVGDVMAAEFPADHFDLAALIYLHLPPALRSTFHARVARWIKPGGRIILEAFNPRQLSNSSFGPKDVNMLMTAAQLESDFAGLEILELEETTVTLSEGAYHSGKGDIVRLFARKS